MLTTKSVLSDMPSYSLQTKGHFFSEEIVSDTKIFLAVFALYIFQMHFNLFSIL